jgi:hypothetical protein
MNAGTVTDYRGRPILHCSRCGRALTADDFFALGLRLPDDGESREEYCEAELIDGAVHGDCALARQAG